MIDKQRAIHGVLNYFCPLLGVVLSNALNLTTAPDIYHLRKTGEMRVKFKNIPYTSIVYISYLCTLR